MNLGERGVAGVIAAELTAGEIVGVELRLPLSSDSMRMRARVCYQDKLSCGLEFLGLSDEQRAAIAGWAERTRAKIQAESDQNLVSKTETMQPTGRWKSRQATLVWVLLLLVISAAAATLWWRWNRGWKQLESGLPSRETVSSPASLQVPAEVMEKLLVHRVDPAYPLEAKKHGIEGVIALDVVIGRDGSVLSMHALNGPEVLAGAAMDALRWWRFEPYRVNGEPTVVETTVAVEFKR